MKQLTIAARGLPELRTEDLLIDGGNKLGTLGPQDSTSVASYNAILTSIKDANDWVRGLFCGLFS